MFRTTDDRSIKHSRRRLFMKFKKLFSIVLMTVICFNIVSVRVFADNVSTENIAIGTRNQTTYADSSLQLESESKEELYEGLGGVFSSNLVNETYTKSTTVYPATRTSCISKKASQTRKYYSEADLRLMSSIIYCEASGESYAGKLAVGIVVMNRKKSNLFPNTVKGVVYQKNQFTPSRNGALAKALKRYDAGKFTSSAEKQCIKAAKAALSGTRSVTYKSKAINLKGYYFFSRYLKGCKVKIGHHQFK